MSEKPTLKSFAKLLARLPKDRKVHFTLKEDDDGDDMMCMVIMQWPPEDGWPDGPANMKGTVGISSPLDEPNEFANDCYSCLEEYLQQITTPGGG